jgi:hypothetical protein
MLLQPIKVVASAALALAVASGANGLKVQRAPSIVERDGVNHVTYDHAETGASLDFVKNSGICETTPGVNQYSGYLNVGSKSTLVTFFRTLLTKIREHEHVVLVLRVSRQAGGSSSRALVEWRPRMLLHDWLVPGIHLILRDNIIINSLLGKWPLPVLRK